MQQGAILFPMDGDMASRLLLDAASTSHSSEGEAGHPGDTPGIQTTSQDDACSGSTSNGASKTPQSSAANQESRVVGMVTRSKTKSRKEATRVKHDNDVSEAEPSRFSDEWERLANISVGIEQDAAVDDCVPSADGAVPSVYGLGDGSEANMEVVQISQVSNPTDVAVNGETGVVSDSSIIPESNVISDSQSVPVSNVVNSPSHSSSERVNSAHGADDSDVASNSDVPNALQLVTPSLLDNVSVGSLIQEVMEDSTLASIRELADHNMNGYSWLNSGVLVHTSLDEFNNERVRIVLPLSKRVKALQLAHDNTAHTGIRGMRRLLNSRFVWPGIHGDIVKFVKSCDVCLRTNQAGNKKALMVERSILTVPFESVAIDLVGPLPKGKRGAKYMLTYVCMASRWPEAIPMRTASAEEAAQCLIQIISRTSIPLKILSDRGTVFLSKLMSALCSMLGIDAIQTSPYRPQSNGVVERLHGTLKPMLDKAVDAGFDWVEFLPLALFALRQIPNRDLGYSPHMIVFGREAVGPLDMLYSGWMEKHLGNVDVEEWLIRLNDQLAMIHDFASATEANAIDSRVCTYNKGKCDRVLNVGDKVLMRIPGRHSALQASWEGPYSITDRVSKVTFKVSKGKNHPTRLAHINNLKSYLDRPLSVKAVTLVAEDVGIDSALLESTPLLCSDKCPGFNSRDINIVLSEVAEYFREKPGLCMSAKCYILLSDNAVPVTQQGRNIPVGIESAVKSELLSKLLEEGIIVKSTSLWSSPLVPVRKKDGSVRICVDFRQLNAVTPLVRYWVPSLDEILRKVGQCGCLSTLDLTAGFHQILMDPESSDLTTFVCPLGKCKFVRMPFGLKNAPAIFQAAVEVVLEPVKHIACNYIDDVVIFSESWDQHMHDLKSVIQCLGVAGLTIKKRKCVFGQKYLTYLGHRIGGGDISIPECRVQALLKFAQPHTKKEMRSFLGALSYYRRFIKGFGSLSALLTPSVSLRAPQQVEWTRGMIMAFGKLRSLLADNVALCVPSPDDNFVLYTDASGDGIGACLHVQRDGEEIPTAFYSRQLRPAERNYSVTELESLAIVSALKHFETLVYAKELTVVTDHRACLALQDGKGLNRRLLRFALTLQDRPIKIVHRPGSENCNADGFSRQFWNVKSGPDPVLSARPGGSSLGGGDVGLEKIERGRKKRSERRREVKEEEKNIHNHFCVCM